MKHLTFFAALLLAFIPASAQTITLPLVHNTVTPDGHMDASEWGLSGTVYIPVSGSDSVLVRYHHDSSALYLAFAGKLESANMLFPEILTDAQYQKTPAWTNGQWWLHVSATDCEHEGAYGVYDDCKTVQPGWQAGPNFVGGAPNTDTVEVVLPFSKMGFNWASDTIGISFLVTNTATIFKLWPAAADRNSPATWGRAVFSKQATVPVRGVWPGSGFRFFPNPASDRLNLENLESGTRISVRDIRGQEVRSSISSAGRAEISLKELAAGTYLLYLRSLDGKPAAYLFQKS